MSRRGRGWVSSCGRWYAEWQWGRLEMWLDGECAGSTSSLAEARERVSA